MGGIDWGAVPVIIEMFGIEDVESFILQLIEIREFQHRE
jgi:hypothetical protein